jgi:hypothetical protein
MSGVRAAPGVGHGVAIQPGCQRLNELRRASRNKLQQATDRANVGSDSYASEYTGDKRAPPTTDGEDTGLPPTSAATTPANLPNWRPDSKLAEELEECTGTYR